MVIKSLALEGYYVMEAASGIEALMLTHKTPPDLILLDLNMPGMDGFEVCKQLRQDSATVTVPVIMLTAQDQTESKVRGFQIGADDYLTKPFELDELTSRIQAHLRRSARDVGANPLTTLPGNQLIEQIVRQRLVERKPLAVLYVDLTNFKAFNDEYGWLQGDQVIRTLAQQIIDAVRTVGGKDDFVGHIGGDDFVVISTPSCAEAIAQSIVAQFDATVPRFYTDADRRRGYIQAVDRQGNPFRAPLLTVSIAVISNEHRDLRHPGQVAEQAADLKKYVKSLPGSQYALDRRRK